MLDTKIENESKVLTDFSLMFNDHGCRSWHLFSF